MKNDGLDRSAARDYTGVMKGLCLSLVLLLLAGCAGEGNAAKGQFEVVLSEEEWRERLTEEQFRVLRGGRTERIGSGAYLKTTAEGLYLCAGCENPLFGSDTKYDSGTGWPSFWAPIGMRNVHQVDDRIPSEVLCGRCGGHLGHVFSNGPEPTGLRYCINSVALQFQSKQ